jgi:hypothetical protein
MQNKAKEVNNNEVVARRLKSPGHQAFNLSPSKINKTGKKKKK